ncbi:hypothetical protein N7450_010769 [Penicillium hetheringtonii]|uniref:Uncharacterized protein n=1 Tax=Penicillium hetheringtonii TaxID=911720 RepID=A0AAD6D8X8_9EURO|nr:hypothetical protein N7450_010769 [Penicillium hetheringtonii]
MSRYLPWAQAEETVDLTGESPSRKRVKRERLSDDYMDRYSSPIMEVKQEDLKNSQPSTSINEHDASDHPPIGASRYKNFVKNEYIDDSHTPNRPVNHHANDLERPTDGRTTMPKELQIKKNIEALRTRQQDAFQQTIAQRQDENIDEDASENDDFAGTHFHRLMTTRKSVWSLTGVFGMKIKSSTRAAAGFGPPPSMIVDRPRIKLPRPLQQQTGGSHESTGAVTESSDEDDLDGPSYRASTSTRSTKNKVPKVDELTVGQTQCPNNAVQKDFTQATVQKPKPTPGRGSQTPTVGFKSRMQSLIDDLDELPEPSESKTSISVKKERSPSTSKTPDSALAEQNLESKKSRSHNVPTFLL